MGALPCGCPQRGRVVRRLRNGEIRASWYAPSCAQGIHAHPELRLVVPLTNGFATTYGSRTLDVARNAVLIRPAYAEHADRYTSEERCLTIAVAPDYLPAPAPVAVRDHRLTLLGAEIAVETDATDSASQLVLDALLAELRFVFTRADASSGACAPPAWLRSLRRYIEERAFVGLTLDDAAQYCNREASYVAHRFKRAYGVTIGECLRAERLRQGRELLARTSASIAEVAQHCGYADQSHFTRHFRRAFFLTPSQYRNRKARAASISVPR